MNESIQAQLERIRPGLNPKATAHQDLENLFKGEDTNNIQDKYPNWEKIYGSEIKKLLDKAEVREEIENQTQQSDVYLRYAFVACLTALTGSCLFMLKKSCTNSDKSPKFRL
jgi:hypothetical protein